MNTINITMINDKCHTEWEVCMPMQPDPTISYSKVWFARLPLIPI